MPTTKRPLQVGDRVKLFGYCFAFQEDYFADEWTGQVAEIRGDKARVDVDDRTLTVTAHVRQCARLKKRERRRVWIAFPQNTLYRPIVDPHGILEVDETVQTDKGGKWVIKEVVEFVEARPRKGKA